MRARALYEDHDASLYESGRYDLAETQLKAAIARRPLSSAQAGGTHYRASFDAGQTVGHPIWLQRELADVYARTEYPAL